MERETERGRASAKSNITAKNHCAHETSRPRRASDKPSKRAPRTQTTERQHERARPTQDRAREGENRETQASKPNKGRSYSKRERREILANKRGSKTESKGEHASKLENSRRERKGEVERGGGDEKKKSRRVNRHHSDTIALHARSQCRKTRETKRASAPQRPKLLSDNMSKRAPRKTYVQNRRESRSKAEGRKPGEKRVTPLGATNPLASFLTRLERLTLARGTAIPSLFLIRARSPFSLPEPVEKVPALQSAHEFTAGAPEPV